MHANALKRCAFSYFVLEAPAGVQHGALFYSYR